MTCRRSQEFLAKEGVTVSERVTTRETTLDAERALELAGEADEIIAAKGRKIVRINVKKDRPGRDALLAVLLGPTGNLRAPAIVRGRTLMVGFDAATYREVLR